jgi:hypothetical protein
MSKQFSAVKSGLGLADTVSFGKYKYCIWQDVVLDDPEYVLWIVCNMDLLLSRELLVASIKSASAKGADKKKNKAESYCYEPNGETRKPAGYNEYPYGSGEPPEFDDIPF